MKTNKKKKEVFGGFDKTSYKKDLKKDLSDKKFKAEFDYDRFIYETAYELSKLREHKGMSQQQLADIAGIKRQAVTRLEMGQENMTLSTLYKISRSLGKTPVIHFN